MVQNQYQSRGTERTQNRQGDHDPPPQERSSEQWELREPFGAKLVFSLLIVAVILSFSFHRMGLGAAASETAKAVAYSVNLADKSMVAENGGEFAGKAIPFILWERQIIYPNVPDEEVEIPMFGYIQKVTGEKQFNATTHQWEEVGDKRYLVRPYGYVSTVLYKLLETVEMGFWGTILSLCLAVPLGFLGARNLAPARFLMTVSRSLSSLSRAIPEMIIALFCVLMFGFGTAAGIIALGLHTCGFFGKFFADDIENCDRGPQDALRATGANRVQVFRYAILPQVLPQYIAYIQYIFERNVRTATVLGIVGAGGIGFELMARWSNGEYGRVSTILLFVFIAVILLERVSQAARKRLI